MAKRETITYVSDLSGDSITDNDAPTVSFSWDGTDYNIDLTSKEHEKFHKVIEPYLSAATKVGKSTGKRGGRKVAASGPAAADIRGWAAEQGIDVPARGRIPQDVRDAYDAAN